MSNAFFRWLRQVMPRKNALLEGLQQRMGGLPQQQQVDLPPPVAIPPQASRPVPACQLLHLDARGDSPSNWGNFISAADVRAGVLDGKIITGIIRVNPSNYQQCFLPYTVNGVSQCDLFIEGIDNRNQALNGDEVAVVLSDESQWKPWVGGTPHPTLPKQPTGRVVRIMQQNNNRIAIGFILKPSAKKSNNNMEPYALFAPKDRRYPYMRIPLSELPGDFATNYAHYERSLFACQLIDWPQHREANGCLVRNIGSTGSLSVENEALLISHSVDTSPFPDNVMEGVPAFQGITDDELLLRRDLRDVCIFTIDPATARDLDDALSVEKISDNHYVVGVHIADVSHFVRPSTPVDAIARKRTTSTYLVDRMIPMLPEQLCADWCSLNPNCDRLAFSVQFHMDENANIIDETWFGRTVIHSCTKLSYEVAQDLIDNRSRDDMAKIDCQLYSFDTIRSKVLMLNRLAEKLRAKRMKKGALRLDQVKIAFKLDPENDWKPFAFSRYDRKPAHELVEEFMLLANIAVAHRIYDSYPDHAVLRHHPPPQLKQIEEVQSLLNSLGHPLDLSNSLTTAESLSKYTGDLQLTLITFVSKINLLAKYFKSETNRAPEQYAHYALAVHVYTHFTSPIRRYPDVLVHRLLGCVCDGLVEPNITEASIQSVMDRCNLRRYDAKLCSDESVKLYYAAFVCECGPFEERARVVNVLDHSFEVMLINVGIIVRVYANAILDVAAFEMRKNKGLNVLDLRWKNGGDASRIEMLMELNVTVTGDVPAKNKDHEPFKWGAIVSRLQIVDSATMPARSASRRIRGSSEGEDLHFPVSILQQYD